ncbi:unnamed protein product, partial [Rotaria sp. Silwood2]
MSCSNRITYFEHLSDEVFYEIFEYIDGWNIYKGFFNLNSRFQNLIIHSPIPFKIKLYSLSQSEVKHYCNNVIVSNKHCIISLYFENESFINELFIYCVIDSSFDRLESIFLGEISFDQLMTLFFYLKSLPRLFSLTIHPDAEWGYDLSTTYRMIFSLPTLKYNKLSLFSDVDEDLNFFVPLAINEPFSAIEYLIMDHNCSLNELFSMFRHTPQLRHLSCQNLIESESSIDTKKSVILSNLTYLRIGNSQIGFDEFEMFIAEISSPLQVLNIRQYMGEDYLDADRWEQLIKIYIPHLRRFDYEYYQLFMPGYEETFLYKNINRFSSPFWIERQCFFEVKIKDNDMIYAIHPYKNLCLDIYKHAQIAKHFNQNIAYNSTQHFVMLNQQDIDKPSTLFIPTSQLSINGISSAERSQSFIDKFKSTFVAAQFTRLNINCTEIPIGILVNILYILPNLDSLKVTSLPFIEEDCLFDNDGEMRYLTSISNKITK